MFLLTCTLSYCQIAATIMPEDYRHKRCGSSVMTVMILLKHSHIIGNKCCHCNSYNTYDFPTSSSSMTRFCTSKSSQLGALLIHWGRIVDGDESEFCLDTPNMSDNEDV
ncbi:PREDICTED: uncharacterized protein LOC104588368 [Nelumbo nucifera]|uniref:Uncharacterized protein LOC104588368 n=1 Tax=Nelumbo nucifera TaxID=4432 RepID=A0A1U7YVR7_NELNU|nr:PREDICTED: uncharacterized protein LOC104588368 [Nelumbo nucifera]